jgi:hypothetical protein
MGLRHLLPIPEGLEAPLEHPFGLSLLLRDEPDDILIEARWNDIGLDVSLEAILVRLEYVRFY